MVLIAASFLFQITSALFAYKIRCAISSYTALQIDNCIFISIKCWYSCTDKILYLGAFIVVWFQMGNWNMIILVIAHWTTNCAPLWVITLNPRVCWVHVKSHVSYRSPRQWFITFFSPLLLGRTNFPFINPGRSVLSYVKMNSVYYSRSFSDGHSRKRTALLT